MISYEEYCEIESEDFPYSTEWGYVVTSIDLDCPKCEEKVINQKFRFNEFSNCLDIVGVGICDDCKLVVTGKPIRIYRDGRFTWQDQDGSWKMRTPTLMERFKKWIGKFRF